MHIEIPQIHCVKRAAAETAESRRAGCHLRKAGSDHEEQKERKSKTESG